jgi:hypothetical protein
LEWIFGIEDDGFGSHNAPTFNGRQRTDQFSIYQNARRGTIIGGTKLGEGHRPYCPADDEDSPGSMSVSRIRKLLKIKIQILFIAMARL